MLSITKQSQHLYAYRAYEILFRTHSCDLSAEHLAAERAA